MSDPNEIKLQLPLRWIDDGSAVVVADQFILRQHDNQYQLVVGHVGNPLVTGPPEEQVKQLQEMGSLPVYVRGRFLLDATSLKHLGKLLAMANADGNDSEVIDG